VLEMRKIMFRVCFTLLFLCCYAQPLIASTANFKITVTIPAIIGLNVAEEPEFQVSTADGFDPTIIREEIKREGELILLETIVLK